MNVIQGAGIFIYPLGFCSILAVYMIVERLIALRSANVLPVSVLNRLVFGDVDQIEADERSVAGRIVMFNHEGKPDAEALKAFTRFEIARLERGMFILDFIVAGAPLLGLLGTIVGLMEVFSNISVATGMPDPSTFVEGIALALTTTMLGLLIAIPALAGSSYLNRRIDLFAAKLDMLLERLLDARKTS